MIPQACQPSVQLVKFKDHEEGIRAVRKAVFIEELGIDPELEWDKHDKYAVYAIAILENDIIGVGRLLADGRIGRVAVLPKWRQSGIGTKITKQLIGAAKSRGLDKITLSSQTTATKFYERLGFNKTGAEYLEAGIIHQDMSLSFSSSTEHSLDE